MPQPAIAAQMWTLRDYVKTPPDMIKTCRRLKQIGYDAIQVSGFGPIEAKDLIKLLDDEGIACASTHCGLAMVRDTARCIDYHRTLRCKHPAIGGFNTEDYSIAVYEQFAREFKTCCDQLLAAGFSGAGYHNHSKELAKFASGQRILDYLIDATAAPAPDQQKSGVWFEIDTYWIAHGGGDPAAWIEKVAGRIPCVHFKDMAVTTAQEPKMCEIGAGNLNWPRILDACRKAQVEWFLIERDRGDLDPFDSLKISLENLRAMLQTN